MKPGTAVTWNEIRKYVNGAGNSYPKEFPVRGKIVKIDGNFAITKLASGAIKRILIESLSKEIP
jgi:hypothetical protein